MGKQADEILQAVYDRPAQTLNLSDVGKELAAVGKVPGKEVVMKNGFNENAGNAWEEVWSESDTYSFLTAATQLKISSTSNNDSSGGTGLQTVLISGLDGAYKPVQETIELNGQTEVLTVNSYIAVNDFLGVLPGSSLPSHDGIVYAGTGNVTGGKPDNVKSVLPIFEGLAQGSSKAVIFTVEADKILLISSVTTFAEQASNVIFSLRIKKVGEIPIYLGTTHIYQQAYSRNFLYPLAISEKTEVSLVAKNVDQGPGSFVSGGFDGLLINK